MNCMHHDNAIKRCKTLHPMGIKLPPSLFGWKADWKSVPAHFFIAFMAGAGKAALAFIAFFMAFMAFIAFIAFMAAIVRLQREVKRCNLKHGLQNRTMNPWLQAIHPWIHTQHGAQKRCSWQSATTLWPTMNSKHKNAEPCPRHHCTDEPWNQNPRNAHLCNTHWLNHDVSQLCSRNQTCAQTGQQQLQL